LDRSSFGKLIAVHGVSPAFQQRAAAVAGLSFLFFLGMMVAMFARGHFGYLLLAASFLVVFVFTMVGWWMQRRNVVELFDRGVAFRKFLAEWQDIATVEHEPGGPLKLTTTDHRSASIPRTVQGLDVLEIYIRGRCSRRPGT
jgi:hypothetical protein